MILFLISDSLLLLTGLTGQATKQGHKTPMAIDDILRLQETTWFAMAMRKNANGPGGARTRPAAAADT
jgi:hypothetical protein